VHGMLEEWTSDSIVLKAVKGPLSLTARFPIDPIFSYARRILWSVCELREPMRIENVKNKSSRFGEHGFCQVVVEN